MLNLYSSAARSINTSRCVNECIDLALGVDHSPADLLIFSVTLKHPVYDILDESKKLYPEADIVVASFLDVECREDTFESIHDMGLMAISGKAYTLAFEPNFLEIKAFEQCVAMAKTLHQDQENIDTIYFIGAEIGINMTTVTAAFEEVFGKDVTVFGATTSHRVKSVIDYKGVNNNIDDHSAMAVGFSFNSFHMHTRLIDGSLSEGDFFKVDMISGNIIAEIKNKPAWYRDLQFKNKTSGTKSFDDISQDDFSNTFDEKKSDTTGNLRSLSTMADQIAIPEKFQKEINLQKVLIDIASTYINLDLSEVDTAINSSLRQMGLFVQADRSYIFDYDFNNLTTSNTYEWCNNDISSEIENLQDIPLNFITDWLTQHKAGNAFYVPSVQDLPEDGPGGLRDILEPQGIKSLITIPLLDGDELVGFVGFDSVKNYYNYSKKEQDLLFLFGQMLINIRNRRHWENQLRIHEEKYRNIIENMNIGLVEVDLDNVIIYANQTFCVMSAYTQDELNERSLTDIIPLINHDNKILKRSNKRDNFYGSYEIEIQNKKGEKRWWFISGAPNYNDKGKLIGSIGVHLDITNQKRIEENLNAANTDLKKINSELDTFVYRVSHDLRTPLVSIISLTELVKSNGIALLGDQNMELMNLISKSANRLDNSIKEILYYSKNARLDLDITEVNIQELVFSVYNDIKYVNADIDFINDFNGIDIIYTDRLRLETILKNLLGNAIKYHDPLKTGKYISFFMSKTDKYYHIEVKDNGIGMSEESLSKVFEMFYRGTASSEGTGLGMFIVKEIVSKLQGEISVESEINVGSIFKLTLPIYKTNKIK
jgi:PAS domain S-box-containing protein